MKRISIIAPLESRGQLDFATGVFVVPPYGILPVATALKNHGYEVKVFSEIVSSEIDWDFVFNSDYVAFSLVFTYCASKGYQYAKMVKEKTGKPIIFGGTHGTILPEDCLQYCDYVVRNEGEETLIDLLDALERKRDLSTVKGISYKLEDGQIVHNRDREFLEDFDDIVDLSLVANYGPLSAKVDPLEALIKQGRLHLQPIQTSRGCPFNCRFCMAPREFGRKYRTKAIETVIAEIDNGLEFLKNNTFVLVDNHFTVDRKRTKELLTRIIERFGPNRLNLVGFARIEVGEDPELLELMKQAGFEVLAIGIESITDSVLAEYDKRQTLRQIDENIDIIHSHGLRIFAAIMFGADADTVQTLRATIDYLIEKDVSHVGINSTTPAALQTKVFGIPQLLPDNRFIHNDWRFFNGNFVVHYPKNMKPSTLQKEIIRGYSKFYSIKRNLRAESFLLQLLVPPARFFRFYPSKFPAKQTLVNEAIYGLLGRRTYVVQPLIKNMKRYIPVLEKFEEGFYDKNENLIQDRLPRVENVSLVKRISLEI